MRICWGLDELLRTSSRWFSLDFLSVFLVSHHFLRKVSSWFPQQDFLRLRKISWGSSGVLFRVSSEGFPRDLIRRISSGGFPQDFLNISSGFPRDFLRISSSFHQDFLKISSEFLQRILRMCKSAVDERGLLTPRIHDEAYCRSCIPCNKTR